MFRLGCDGGIVSHLTSPTRAPCAHPSLAVSSVSGSVATAECLPDVRQKQNKTRIATVGWFG